MRKIDVVELKTFIDAQSPETKIYLGCDSERINIRGTWFADYAAVVVVHIDGKHGCRIFGEVTRERDYDQRKDKPAMRLMNEVYKVSALFQKLADVLEDRDVEVHLDLNPDELHGSNCVIAQAIGYIKGTCNVVPMVKPSAWCSSFAADRFSRILSERKVA
jgi:predicted RNase H-related nuclease YkuK (DUF458 family)